MNPRAKNPSYLDYVRYEERGQIHAVTKRYSVKVTPAILKIIREAGKPVPVARQYIPQLAELETRSEERADPIGDEAHSPVKGIVHRYPDRALLKLSGVCAVYCRYCFRREMIGPESGILGPEEQRAALDYIAAHDNIWEVIFTGGDPLVLSPRRLGAVFQRLMAMEHVRILRIHTRVPLAAPERITDALCDILKTAGKPVYIALHVNHAQELSDDVRAAVKKLRNAGCMLLSQSVLLKDVNDTPEALENLFRALIELQIKPYYLHHPDLAPGTGHFRVPVKKGRALMKTLRGQVSGLCLPSYMLDIPGGYGKIPIGPCYLEDLENGKFRLEDYKGRGHLYPPA